MDLLNEKVIHPKYGAGQISNQELDILSVHFPEFGVKKFPYPDVFGKFMRVCNPDLEILILEEIRGKKARLEEERARKEQLYLESLQQQAEEKIRLATQKRRTAQKAKVKK